MHGNMNVKCLTCSLSLWSAGSIKIAVPGPLFLGTWWLGRHFCQQGITLCSKCGAAECLSRGLCQRSETVKVQGSQQCLHQCTLFYICHLQKCIIIVQATGKVNKSQRWLGVLIIQGISLCTPDWKWPTTVAMAPEVPWHYALWFCFLWGYVKDRVFVPPLPHYLADLQARIIAAVKNIDAPMLTHVWQEFEYHIDVCCVTRGAHFEHL